MDNLPQRLLAASQHINAGRLDKARSALALILKRDPRDVDAVVMLSFVLSRIGDLPGYLYQARRACEMYPGDPRLVSNLASALIANNDAAAAVDAYLNAHALDPTNANIAVGLSNAFNTLHLYDQAETLCRDMLRQNQDARLHSNLAVALLQSGRAREAVLILREALNRFPEDPLLATGLAGASNYAGNLSPREVFDAHVAYGRLVQRLDPNPPAAATTSRDAIRQIRLGILSGDLRAHAVAFFIDPILRLLPRDRWHITCYSTNPHEDAVSQRLQALVPSWRRIAFESISNLDAVIRADRIDILLELSGHTSGHRLALLHRRPAPIQITYFGYPNTTGVPGCGFRIVDSITDPSGPEFDALATERLLRLDPCFLCYTPPDAPPQVAPPPSLESRTITFGSFNSLAKLDDLSINLYAKALLAVPGSRLLLKCHGLTTPAIRAMTARRFSARGITDDRLILETPGQGAAAMLDAYTRMDIMLDSFPYHGTTTTCEALFMGVPVVTLMGGACAARVGGSILSALGRKEWIATTPDDHAHIAACLASAPDLASIRAGLRKQVMTSPVGDAKQFAARFDSLLTSLWLDHCRASATAPYTPPRNGS